MLHCLCLTTNLSEPGFIRKADFALNIIGSSSVPLGEVFLPCVSAIRLPFLSVYNVKESLIHYFRGWAKLFPLGRFKRNRLSLKYLCWLQQQMCERVGICFAPCARPQEEEALLNLWAQKHSRRTFWPKIKQWQNHSCGSTACRLFGMLLEYITGDNLVFLFGRRSYRCL